MSPSQSTRQSTPLSVTGSIEDSAELPAVKRPRKRKSTDPKKPLPRSSTLHGLWGIKPAETELPAVSQGTGEGCTQDGCGRGKLVFRLTPEKLSAVVHGVQNGQNRMITPPRSLPDTAASTVPETPKQNGDATSTTPNSSERRKGKRTIQQSPTVENVRRSPRNHRSSFDEAVFPPAIAPRPLIPIAPKYVPIAPRQAAIAPKPAPPTSKPKTPHPFFLGKEARQALQGTFAPAMTITLSETGEPPRKRQKSVSSDQTTSEPAALLPAKPIQSSKSLHPFFMSRTASMESTVSATSMSLLPLPQGKTVYLGNGRPTPFPPKGMSHVHDNPSVVRMEIRMALKQKKGKATYYNHHGSYSSLANIYPSTDLIPPTKTIYSKSQIQDLAKEVLSPSSHHALLRAYKILCNEDRTKDPDGMAWTYKFRPRRSDEILVGNDAGLQLRNWVSGDRKLSTNPSIPAEMSDFIVDDTEDDVYTDDPISEIDTPQKPKRKKKVFDAYENVVVLVGDHGVGKSAAVYAVAEELGYQVFEISPGGKRGAREIFEAVGEVGQSELVTKHKAINAAPDLSPVRHTLNNGVDDGGERRKGRKGLVCFEEVDVLYEEDKSFWSGVSNLVEKSRRPVILTCNDISGIPQTFRNCRIIEFTPAHEVIVRDFLRIITLSQGHLVDPSLLERYYIESKKDLRRTLSTVQFWCQFGVGDTRGGAEWLNWHGKEDDWVISKDTLTTTVPWRQETAAGLDLVLDATENISPELDLEDLFFPQEFQDLLLGSPTSMFKRHKSTFAALRGMEEFLDTMSFMDCTVDGQFTAYEIEAFHKASADDVLGEPILREHPGQRFEEPQGGEVRWSPNIRILARKVLEAKLQHGGYNIAPISAEKITSQPLKDFLHPRLYLSRDDIYDPLDELLLVNTMDDKYLSTQGLLQPLSTIVTDIAPQIRSILLHEHERQKFPAEQISLDAIWTNTRTTRTQVKAAQEGKRKYFGDKVDTQTALRTGFITGDVLHVPMLQE